VATETIDISGIDPQESLTLSVGWRSGRKTKLRQISIGGDVERAFRTVLHSALQDLNQREPEPWSPDADLTPETYLVLPAADLGDAPVLAAEHGGMSLAAALQAAEALPVMHPDDLPAGDLSFYSLTVGNTAGRRTVFLRRTNPRRGLKKGRFYTFLGDSLQRLNEPIFAFDDRVDLLFVDDRVAVLSQTVFAAMFRDQDVLAAQIPAWADELHSVVPVSDDGRQRLINRALKDTRLRARLEAIVHRGHLPTVSSATMTQALTDAGMDPSTLIDAEGKLSLEEDDIPQMLYFLNEDLFVGALTSTGFRADKKAAR
jgi:hypothetical protein